MNWYTKYKDKEYSLGWFLYHLNEIRPVHVVERLTWLCLDRGVGAFKLHGKVYCTYTIENDDSGPRPVFKFNHKEL